MVEQTHADDGAPTPGVGHETRDISTRVVVIFGSSLVAGAVIVFFVVGVLYVFYGSLQSKAYPREYPMARVGAPAAPPVPRLQVKPRDELKAMRAEEEQYLTSYGWVSEGTGTLHIPIDRAMQLLLQEGVPARPAGQAPSAEGMPEGSSSGRTTVPAERY